MNKWHNILLAFTIISQWVQAQCTCGPLPSTNNWSDFSVTTPLPMRTAKCGHAFKICTNDTIAFRGHFTCKVGCKTYYKTVLKRE